MRSFLLIVLLFGCETASANPPVVTGEINGHQRDFVIDTGASRVALSMTDALVLGIEVDHERSYTVRTVSGELTGYPVVVDEIRVGDVVVSNVDATVLDSENPFPILLGMSFLSQVDAAWLYDVLDALLLRKGS